MDRSDVAYLIKKDYEQDDYGRMIETETKRAIYCGVKSVSHSEKVQNGLIGIYSTYQLSVFKYDYEMEETVEYKGVRYSVYDATEYNDFIRLYVQREQGA